MNIFALGNTGNAVIFKMATARGAEVVDYHLFRNISILLVAAIQSSTLGINVFKQFPKTYKWTLIFRAIFG